ncbi:hypothetical protein N9M66_00205 [Litoreibacter sp.]|nr:hypothetical protein [Litoreibacter sp.]
MLSIIAASMMTASRQDRDRWPDHRTDYADRFTADPKRREAERRRRFNPYSYFQ